MEQNMGNPLYWNAWCIDQCWELVFFIMFFLSASCCNGARILDLRILRQVFYHCATIAGHACYKFFTIFSLCSRDDISGVYYKLMTIVSDDSRVVNKLEASLTDDARVVIYDRHMFKVQATGCKPLTYGWRDKYFTIGPLLLTMLILGFSPFFSRCQLLQSDLNPQPEDDEASVLPLCFHCLKIFTPFSFLVQSVVLGLKLLT
jgi:hypothetical protein